MELPPELGSTSGTGLTLSSEQPSTSASTSTSVAPGQASGSESTHANRVSRACQACNRKKSRCSGHQPCELCKRIGAECTYVAAQKRGRKRKASLAVDVQSQTQQPVAGPSYSGKEHQGSSIAGPMSAPPRFSALPFKSEEHTADLDSSADERSTSFARQLFRREHGPHLASFSQLLSPERLDNSLNESQMRMYHPTSGSPGSSGPIPLHYPPHQPYASTSSHRKTASEDPHLLHNQQLYNPLSTSSTSSTQAGPSGIQYFAGMSEGEMEEYLYRDYWAIVHPLWPILYRPALSSHMIKSRYPLLHHMIMTVASTFRRPEHGLIAQATEGMSTHERERCAELGQKHLAAFKASLDVHMPPDYVTVQALLLAAFKEMAQATVHLVWRYLGLAVSMCTELGLHERTVPIPAGHPGYAVQQAKLRVVWGVYIADKYISLALGRPCMLSGISMKCNLPNIVESDELALWASDAAGIIPQSICKELDSWQALTMTNFVAWTKLALILEQIADQIYSNRSENTQRTMKNLLALHEKMQRWATNYPPILGSFAEDEETLQKPPHLIFLRMWFSTCRLVLHRPFVSRSVQFHEGPRLLSSYEICMEAAESICNLARCYSRSLGGLGRVSNACIFMIFQAGILFVANSTSDDPQVAQHCAQRLSLCLGWMDEIGISYEMTDRYREVLQALWEMAKRRGGTHDPVPFGHETHVGPSQAFMPAERPTFDFSVSLPSELDPALAPSSSSANGLGHFMDAASNPVDHIHGSFWDAMPLTAFNSSEWAAFAAQYDSLLS